MVALSVGWEAAFQKLDVLAMGSDVKVTCRVLSVQAALLWKVRHELCALLHKFTALMECVVGQLAGWGSESIASGPTFHPDWSQAFWLLKSRDAANRASGVRTLTRLRTEVRGMLAVVIGFVDGVITLRM